MIKVGINGFGRMGLFWTALQHLQIQVVTWLMVALLLECDGAST
jgi:glyceraldehyde-3-phosphate dehydrogenase/erythrose-4-phosphate dehydrogenase